MANRFQNALMIQEGACNPSGIANALKEACRECIAEGVSQREDPAVRLIVHQLAFLCNVYEIDHTLNEYAKLRTRCEARVSEIEPA